MRAEAKKRWRDGFVAHMLKDHKEKYHPELHPAIEQMYANAKIEEMGSMMTISSNWISDIAQVEFKKARAEFLTKNSPTLVGLMKEHVKIDTAVVKSLVTIKARMKINKRIHNTFDEKRVALEKKLGLYKYLTKSGKLSKAKLAKMCNSVRNPLTDEDLKGIANIYNTEYLPVRDELAHAANKKMKEPTEEESDAYAEYEELDPKLSALVEKIYSLSANTLTPTMYDDFSSNPETWSTNYWR